MALVAYDNSDSSDFEDDENVNFTNTSKITESPKIVGTPTSTADIDIKVSTNNIFKLLPATKQNNIIEEVDDEFLHKKAPVTIQKARITVPSLNDFKDVEDSIPINKPRITNGKKSGLLSILPQPKNVYQAKSFIPNVLTQKPTSATKKPLLSSTATITKSKTTTHIENDSDEDSDGEENGTDFFSINKKSEEISVEDIPLNINILSSSQQITVQKSEPIQSYFKELPAEINMELEQPEPSQADYQEVVGSYNGQMESTAAPNSMELDDEAIRQLCGSRGRRKKEDIQIVDVNQQEVLAGAREMLMKGLMDDTTKRVSAKRKGDGPTSQQKRKHQITYLAHQAKANEAELQNQWANSRISRRQTQSKYGF